MLTCILSLQKYNFEKRLSIIDYGFKGIVTNCITTYIKY